MKYLIIKREYNEDLFDTYVERIPVCMVNKYEKYDDYGYEIYELCANNSFKLIKEYDQTINNKGMAIYGWNTFNEDIIEIINKPDFIYQKYNNKDRKYFTKNIIEEIKNKYGFKETVEEIYKQLCMCGEYGENTDEGKWLVIGEYIGNKYDWGY